MACHCRRWSSEPSSAQILHQICKLLQLLLHLLPLAIVIPLFLLGGLLQLLHPVFQRRNLASTGAVPGALTTGRASCPSSLASYLVDPSVNTGGRAGEFGQLLPGEVRMCRITPHFVDLFVVRSPGARRTSVLTHILASLLGDDGHLHHHGSLVVELVHQLFPILLFLQLGVESQPAAVADELARRPEPVPQAASIARLRQQPILAVQELLIPDFLDVVFPVITTNSSIRGLSFAGAVFKIRQSVRAGTRFTRGGRFSTGFKVGWGVHTTISTSMNSRPMSMATVRTLRRVIFGSLGRCHECNLRGNTQ